jgi:hypothetical protein
MNPVESIGKPCFSRFCNKQDANTFNRLMTLALVTGSPYTMAAKVIHNNKVEIHEIRIQRYSSDVMTISKKLMGGNE